jgi:hypothetical protein
LVARTDEFEEGYAVVRADPPCAPTGSRSPVDLIDSIYVKDVWWARDEADAEVERLNAFADERGTGSRYHCEYVRVRRRL